MNKTRIPTRRDSSIHEVTVKSKFQPRSTTSSRLKEKTNSNSMNPSLATKNIFRHTPTEKKMSQRSLPKELLGKPRIVGNDGQIELLFNHTKEIAHDFFPKAQYNILFPNFFNISSINRLSFLSNNSRTSSISTSSKIPVLRKSSIAPDIDLNSKEPTEDELSMKESFDFLNSILNQKSTVPNLTDFFILYVSLVLAICNQAAAKNSLEFLLHFLEFKTTRTQEVNILFAVLIRVCDGAPELREMVIDCLAKLAQLEKSLVTRLENGSTHHDASLSSLCKDVFKKMGRSTTERKEMFTSISDTADINLAQEQLLNYVDTLEDNGQPSDIIDFVRNVTSVMNRFNESAVVLERAASCVQLVIPFSQDLPVELIYNSLSLCFSIMSGEKFLDGERAFYASEAIQSLTQTIFDSMPPNKLIPAIAALVSQPSKTEDNSKIKMIIDHFNSYVGSIDNIEEDLLNQVNDALEIFHPEMMRNLVGIKKVPDELDIIESREKSIRNLNSQETILDEIKSLVESSDNCDFNDFPYYIRPVLQAAWMIENEDKEVSEEFVDRELFENVHSVINKIGLLDDDEIDDSEYGVDSLQKKFDLMIGNTGEDETKAPDLEVV